jgi:putative transposase
MPRANRHFLHGYVWHITHQCREGSSNRSKGSHRSIAALRSRGLIELSALQLFRSCDRHSYLRWLLEAKKRFGLSVLDYIVTCNHVHLLIRDTGPNVVANSMQLIAGRTGQEYNRRKGRHGAFWEDRYQVGRTGRC